MRRTHPRRAGDSRRIWNDSLARLESLQALEELRLGELPRLELRDEGGDLGAFRGRLRSCRHGGGETRGPTQARGGKRMDRGRGKPRYARG